MVELDDETIRKIERGEATQLNACICTVSSEPIIVSDVPLPIAVFGNREFWSLVVTGLADTESGRTVRRMLDHAFANAITDD